MLLILSFMYTRNRNGPMTEPCGTPNIIQGVSDAKEITLSSFGCFQLFHRRFTLIRGICEGLCQRLW